jgi:hypothetical protein
MRATEGIRTLDLAFTKRLLCQLSYGGQYISYNPDGGHYTSEEGTLARLIYRSVIRDWSIGG